MEIKTNLSLGGVNGLSSTPVFATGTKSAADSGSFASSAALQSALQNTPDVRSDAVARAREMIGNSNYPSVENIASLSNFLAAKISSPE